MGEKVKEFLAYLESHVGDAYVWGAQGERVDNRADLENGYGARRLRAARPNARLHTSKSHQNAAVRLRLQRPYHTLAARHKRAD